jgi:hypothetical protein
MRWFPVVVAGLAFILGCGPNNGNDGGCPTARCGGSCCGSGNICVMDKGGHEFCAVKCHNTRDCPGASPCCEPVIDDGGYSGHGACQPNPLSNDWYSCLCALKTDCASGGACAPAVNTSGIITGPYVCVLSDGQGHNGCAGEGIPQSCSNALYCARDNEGNDFCAIPCTHDALCNNPGVSCCNTQCSQGSCCGLCGN